MNRATRIGLCLGLLAQSSCMLFASKSDYADYRAIRLTTEPTERAIAMRNYVEKHREGQWRDEVEQERDRQEHEAFETGKDSQAGLEHYLAAYPKGIYVAQARGRLEAVGLIEKQRKQAQEQAAQLAEQRKLRAQELRRTWLGRFLGYWLETLSSLRGWGEPIPAVANNNPQFSRAFGAQPRPRCTQDECVKYYAGAYAVPVPGGNRIERQLSLLLRLRMRSGKLERAELLLPDRGFSRWYELEERQAISSGERAEREKAVQWAMKRALPLIEQLAGGVTALPNAVLPKIEAPAIGPTGELIDTSVEKPTDPQNSAQAQDNAGIGVAAVKPGAPSAAELVKPESPTAPADMVFDPLGVGKQGQRIEVPTTTGPAAPPASGGPSSEMTFSSPMEVPRTGPAAAQPAGTEASGGPAAAGETIAPVVRSFLASGLQVTLFAAGSEGPGYDGMVIEQVSKRSAGRPSGLKTPAAPAAASPPAGAAPAPKPAAQAPTAAQ